MSPNTVPDTSQLDALSPEQQERLADVLERYLADLDAGRTPSADDLVAAHPDLEAPLREHLASLDFLRRAAAELQEEGNSPAQRLDLADKRLGDYQIVREIGRGGMGIVYEAMQISLGRRVALKVLPFAAVLDPKQIARFGNEARAAAQLHHPNIVPVFSVGCERGVHYYAMQYIEGQPLDRAIRQLRQLAQTEPVGSTVPENRKASPSLPVHPPAPPSTWHSFTTAHSIRTRDYALTVARLGVEAAEALHHAHEYGIVHRDVKPSNLLLDAQGKLWVTDFGLARFQVGGGLTMTGDVLGTVCYMSPEQAGGRTHLIDHRTDIYSLGITLYELLTLHDAFEEGDRHRVVRRILEDDPRPPRQYNPAIPVDLETIVLKATAKQRDQRYASAQELADDLRRFLDGKPTLARRPTLAERLSRWTSRHKAAVRLALATLAVAMVGLVASMALIAREHGRTRAALAKSEAHFHQARELLDRFGGRMAEDLASVPGAERLREEILRDTLDYYRQFIRDAGGDPSLRRDLGLTWSKIGSLTEQLGDWEKALAAHQEAARLLAELAAQQPGAAALHADLALCHNNAGLVLSQLGRTDEARLAYQQAIALQKPLVAAHADVPRFRSELALTYSNLGLLQSQTGDSAGAAAAFQDAVRIQQALVADYPETLAYPSDLAGSYNHLAILHSQSAPDTAVRWCRKALAIQEKLVTERPDDFEYLADVALTCNNLGTLESHAGRRDQAVAAYSRAIALQEQLARKAPSVVRFRRDLAVSLNNLGRVESDSADGPSAREAFLRARGIVEQLVRDYPEELNYRSSLGGILNNLGMTLEQLGNREEAVEVYRAAIEHQQFALRRAAQVEQFRVFLSKQYWNYGRVLRELGNADEAAKTALARKALWPGNPDRLYHVAGELALAAAVKPQGGQTPWDEAIAGQSLAVLREAVTAGFLEVDRLRRDPEWEPLRDDPRFLQLVDEMEHSPKDAALAP